MVMKVDIYKCEECSGALGEEYFYPVPKGSSDPTCPFGHERYAQERVENSKEKVDKIEIIGGNND